MSSFECQYLHSPPPPLVILNELSLTFVQPSLDAGHSLNWTLGIFQDGASLVAHSQILSTFQDGGRVKFPTLGIVVDVKIPTHVRFTRSNSPGLPDPPSPPLPSWGKPMIDAWNPHEKIAWHLRVVRNAVHSGKKWRSALWLNALHSGKSDEFKNSYSLAFYIFFLNPDDVAARSLRPLRSNKCPILALVNRLQLFSWYDEFHSKRLSLLKTPSIL